MLRSFDAVQLSPKNVIVLGDELRFQSVIQFTAVDRTSNSDFGQLGSLSTRVFETRTAIEREHFTCQDSGVSPIFIIIISNGENILSIVM